ncbi:NAD(P)-binding oxidoreductase [Nesterenkonia sp. CF4.4]|uniref:NAD(P)-binding oxidoreductase n=1 Tax=Nesterenkonia sp. CF4.4 TaxID=3373079 RepID=UPI003EE63E2A
MEIFIIGITGGIGGQLAAKLLEAGDTVRGLVRRPAQRDDLSARGIQAVLGDLAALSPAELAQVLGAADAVVFSAGSNGGPAQITRAIDGAGLSRTIEASLIAGVRRLISVSVLPEAWRERELSDSEEHYFAVKKQGDIALSHGDLDWVILRPSMLTDAPGAGTVSLGPAEAHGEIPREDVAEILKELLHEPRISRQILEVDDGQTPIPAAVQANVPRR